MRKVEFVSAEPNPKRESSPSTIAECALDLLLNQKYCDVTLIVGTVDQERIECHKFPLIARSSVFEAMFSGRWNGDKNQEFEIPDAEPHAFKLFLKVIIKTDLSPIIYLTFL